MGTRMRYEFWKMKMGDTVLEDVVKTGIVKKILIPAPN